MEAVASETKRLLEDKSAKESSIEKLLENLRIGEEVLGEKRDQFEKEFQHFQMKQKAYLANMQELEKKSADLSKALAKFEQESADFSAKMESRNAAATLRELQSKELLEKAEMLRAEYEEKLAKLKQAMGV
jgi:peptidoglycan hydrolase CwlO-like protein